MYKYFLVNVVQRILKYQFCQVIEFKIMKTRRKKTKNKIWKMCLVILQKKNNVILITLEIFLLLLET